MGLHKMRKPLGLEAHFAKEKGSSRKAAFYMFVQFWLKWRPEYSAPMLKQVRITEKQNATEAVNYIWLEYVLYYTVFSRDTVFSL